MTPTDATERHPAEAEHLARLERELATRAGALGLVDIAHRSLDTPIGTILLAATEAGLIRVGLPVESHEQVLDELAARISPRILQAPRRLDGAARQLEAYFSGQIRRVDVPLDLRLTTEFQRRVLRTLADRVGFGRTTSYAELARQSGSPRAVRAVGTACARNPLPIVLPCHRVLRSGGGLGGYLGGPVAKEFLLRLERGPLGSDHGESGSDRHR